MRKLLPGFSAMPCCVSICRLIEFQTTTDIENDARTTDCQDSRMPPGYQYVRTTRRSIWQWLTILLGIGNFRCSRREMKSTVICVYLTRYIYLYIYIFTKHVTIYICVTITIVSSCEKSFATGNYFNLWSWLYQTKWSNTTCTQLVHANHKLAFPSMA